MNIQSARYVFSTGAMQRQRGAALLMSLILLAVISVMGIANIESSSLEMKMVTSAKERNMKFAIAEAALVQAEDYLVKDVNPSFSDLYTDTSCSGSHCFNNNCSNHGLCFEGEFDSTLTRYDCKVFTSTSKERQQYWKDQSIWNTDSKHKKLQKVKVQDVEMQPKAIVEFLCFVEPAGSTVEFNATNPNVGEPLFRVTVLVDEEGDRRTSVMLQSTFLIDL